MESLPPKRRHLGCRIALILMGLLILAGVGVFLVKTVHFYRAFRNGTVNNNMLNRELSSSISKLKANPDVSVEDLKRLAIDSAPSQGPQHAKLTIVEFLDFGCPYCRALMPDLRSIQQKYQNQVRIIYRDFPIEELHPTAMNAALAARCAQAQGKYLEYHDKLFLNQDRQTSTDFTTYATELGLNVPKFETCIKNREPEALIRQDMSDGLLVGVSGTPTLFFNGVRIQGAPDKEVLEYIIQEFLKDETPTSTKR